MAQHLEKHFGPEHPDTVKVLRTVAATQKKMAEKFMKQNRYRYCGGAAIAEKPKIIDKKQDAICVLFQSVKEVLISKKHVIPRTLSEAEGDVGIRPQKLLILLKRKGNTNIS